LKYYPHYIIDVARGLRRNQTLAEELLWNKLRRHNLCELKFRRQHHIGRYVVDFYCSELKLIIEVDGDIHDRKEQKEYDSVREEELRSSGYLILRVKNDEVFDNIDSVIERILTFNK
jgi:very-short-patch-repair endonuclease